MAIGILCDKAQVEHYLDALANGKPIQPGDKGWSAADRLVLAGACFFGAVAGEEQGEVKEKTQGLAS
jgi:hypothetical protein